MINVVAAIIRNKDNKILIAQRNLKKSQGGLWEFPGGKIESNETKEEAIIREIKEELDMNIEVYSYFDEKLYEYPDKVINLIALNCTMLDDHYDVLEHEKVEWINKQEFDNFDFAPADVYFVNKLKSQQ
jgi:8-oxo-dGTP diphosphatase